jgi:hypothetical protein
MTDAQLIASAIHSLANAVWCLAFWAGVYVLWRG